MLRLQSTSPCTVKGAACAHFPQLNFQKGWGCSTHPLPDMGVDTCKVLKNKAPTLTDVATACGLVSIGFGTSHAHKTVPARRREQGPPDSDSGTDKRDDGEAGVIIRQRGPTRPGFRCRSRAGDCGTRFLCPPFLSNVHEKARFASSPWESRGLEASDVTKALH